MKADLRKANARNHAGRRVSPHFPATAKKPTPTGRRTKPQNTISPTPKEGAEFFQAASGGENAAEDTAPPSPSSPTRPTAFISLSPHRIGSVQARSGSLAITYPSHFSRPKGTSPRRKRKATLTAPAKACGGGRGSGAPHRRSPSLSDSYLGPSISTGMTGGERRPHFSARANNARR